MDGTNEVWTLAEVRDGEMCAVSRELLAWGRELADELKSPLASIVLGKGIAAQAEELIKFGADKIYLVESEELTNLYNE